MNGSRLLSTVVLVAVLLGGVLTQAPTARASDSWTPAAPLATNHAGHSATLLADGTVLVAGGTTAERYDPTADRWTPAGTMVTYHSSHTATLLPNGEVLVAGGFALPVTGNAMAERYDPASNTWRAAAPMTTPRVGHTATLLPNGQVLAVGGSPDARNTGLASAERYDPAADRWLPAGAMNATRLGHTATLLPTGQVLVVGGTTLGGGVGQYLASAELYDPATDRWSATGALATPRSGHQAVLLATGQVLVLGGANQRGLLDSAELYDPATGRWTATGTLVTPRVGHTATLLRDGRVLVTGGNPPAASATTELYDPATGRWTASAPMSSARVGHTATLLPDGRVLVVGGMLAELYTTGAPPPPEQCFQETGKCVRGRFLAYWQAHGGLALNGYPLSGEFTQTLEDGRAHTVQYFERVRLEYHPENQPPYDILLGQFGRRIHAADPPTTPIPGQAYFLETGHNLGGDFLTYWQANGGLAQFGYPISEVLGERLEDGQTYTVQYFERARFEYHPENAPPWDIELGQFGRRILAETMR